VLNVGDVFVGVLSSGVQVDELEGDRSSWKEHALWLMEPPSFHDGIHASMLSPLSPVVSPISQSHTDKVIYFQW